MPNRAFNTQGPIAYLITWTTYGTWLPGDERGWHKWGDGRLREHDELLRRSAKLHMREPPFLLSVEDRATVAATVERHCQIRGWVLHAVNARSNHVHVVVSAPESRPEPLRDQLKAWCSRKLKNRYGTRERFWTEGANCRWVNHEDDLEHAIVYVHEAQDRMDRDDRYGTRPDG